MEEQDFQKTCVKLGWLWGAATSSGPLLGLLFLALPFLFPRTADLVAQKVSDQVDKMLNPNRRS